MNLFKLGDFTLNSGAKSKWKLECDALTDDDWKALAQMISLMVGPFSSVEGIPRGGLKLAEYLRPFAGLAGPHLIVDDVWTTGGSMTRAYDAWVERTGGPDRPRKLGEHVKGAVVFSRGQRPYWVQTLFQMPECFWLQPRHR